MGLSEDTIRPNIFDGSRSQHQLKIRGILSTLLITILSLHSAVVLSQEQHRENIDGVYVLGYMSLLLLKSDKHAYSFQVEPNFTDTLTASQEIPFNTSIGTLTIAANGEVTGSLSFGTADEELSVVEQLLLKQLGFVELRHGQLWKSTELLRGRRYNIENALPFAELRKPFEVVIFTHEEAVATNETVSVTANIFSMGPSFKAPVDMITSFSNLNSQ